MQEPRNDFERALIMAGVSATFEAELLKRNDFVDRLQRQGMDFSSIEEAFLRNLSPNQVEAISKAAAQQLNGESFEWYVIEALNLLNGERRKLRPMTAPFTQDDHPVMTRGISPDRIPITKGLSSRR